MKKIAVVGGGKIGSSIYKTLTDHGFLVELGDLHPAPGSFFIDALEKSSLIQWLSKGFDAILCATPYYLIRNVASTAAELGIAYFDLTEDREVTNYVRSLNSKSIVVPQCGLAPGAVSIITADLVKQFDKIKNIDIRVGALPLFPNNSIKYYLTWSTNGLINEYCNLCEVIYNNKKMEVLPLEGYEKISIDGQLYEAFNTSGGIGSLCESLDVENLNYKTIRYVGHHHLMKFLFDDLNLSKNRDLFIKLFDQEVPQTTKDVVVIMVKVVGYKNNKLLENTYFKKIYGDPEQSAIQKTTVGGICGVMMSWFGGGIEKSSGLVKQEDISWSSFTNNFAGEIFKP